MVWTQEVVSDKTNPSLRKLLSIETSTLCNGERTNHYVTIHYGPPTKQEEIITKKFSTDQERRAFIEGFYVGLNLT